MKNQGTVLAIPICLFLTVSAAAQNPGQAAQPRIAPSQLSIEHRPGLAPWLDVRADKREYYAYRRFAPPDILGQLDRPVASPAVRSLLAQRSAAFQSGTRRMRLAIDPDGIVNLGAEQPQDAASVAVVDLGKSPDLLNTLSGELRLDTTNNYVIPVLTSRYAQQRGRSTYITRDTLMVTVAAKNHSRVTLYALEDGRWTKVSDLTPADVPDKNPVSLRDKFKLKPGTEPMQYQGLERIAIAAAQSSAGASSFSQVSGQQWRDLAAQNGLENPLSPVNTGSGLTNSPLGTGKPKPKPAGDKPPPEDIPQVQSYMAYGQSPWCNRQCSAGSCQGCCIAAHAVEEAHVFGASLACHIASDLCPWCHVGCAAMTGVMVATMTTMDTACMKTCQVGNRLPATNNPQRCPVQ